ncbi:MAG TPA: malonate decarboxylase acyl carrier protein, partial [Verrucomicrobiae bacterium]|nr:malonate decarboxylase acyl carrier protein [Verrucomicrobiae bacterium]
MEKLQIRQKAGRRAPGDKSHGITGVVASGNLEVLLERVLDGTECEVNI